MKLLVVAQVGGSEGAALLTPRAEKNGKTCNPFMV